jgi:hypothetical protein
VKPLIGWGQNSTYPTSHLKAALGFREQFSRGPRMGTKRGTDTDDSPAYVVEDGRSVSARWPGDAYLFAPKSSSTACEFRRRPPPGSSSRRQSC